MSNIAKLISGIRIFKATTFQQKKDVINHLLLQGQKPSTMIISCVDLRISPAELFAANPGELYVLNNIGGLVPKYNSEGIHGILAAIEYAVTNIEVENIIILGHSKCESIEMMMSDKFAATTNGLSKSMKTWLSIAGEARDAVKKEMSQKDAQEQQSSCEHESIVVSLSNLMTYPYITQRMAQNKLKIFAMHFDIETAQIMSFNSDTGFFEAVV